MNYNLLSLSHFFIAIWLFLLYYLLYRECKKPIIQEDDKKGVEIKNEI